MLKKMQNIGRITKKPDLRYTADGKPVCKFTIAINDGGEKAEFVSVIAFQRQAETCAQYLDKGKVVYVEGHWEIRTYTDNSGEKRIQVEMNGKRHPLDIVFLPSGGNGSGVNVNTAEKPRRTDDFEREIEENDVPL